jgi:hypothetical protein
VDRAEPERGHFEWDIRRDVLIVVDVSYGEWFVRALSDPLQPPSTASLSPVMSACSG